MWLSILSNDDLEKLKGLGNKLKSGNKTEQRLADKILKYVKNRTEVPYIKKG